MSEPMEELCAQAEKRGAKRANMEAAVRFLKLFPEGLNRILFIFPNLTKEDIEAVVKESGIQQFNFPVK